jgi:hypothetical protein
MPAYQKIAPVTTMSLETVVQNKVLVETDEEIISRLRERFDILNDMTRAVKGGTVRAMIVSGPPGVGKSFGVEAVLNKHNVFAEIANDKKLKKFEIIKGAITALGLYAKLYEYSDPKSILVFDDVDVIFSDELALNILKAALDSSKKRTINWNADSRLLKNEGIPNSFEFKGGCIFITNLKFSQVKSKKLQEHLAALESRCHYLDLTIDTEREKMLRIKQIVGDGMLDEYNFSEEEVTELIEFIDSNKVRMRELSLRTVLKAADLKKSMPANWKKVASLTIMK